MKNFKEFITEEEISENMKDEIEAQGGKMF